MGVMLGQASINAVNRVPQLSYGEATGVTQTVRDYGSSLGLAVLGTISHFVRPGVAEATRSVLLGRSVIMAVAFVGALFGLRRGVQQELPADKRESRVAQAP